VRLRARVRGLYRKLRRRVVGVDAIYEYDPRLTVKPRPLDYLGEEVAGTHRPNRFAIARVHQIEVRIVLDGLHEGVGNRNGDVEIVDSRVVVLAGDELLDVRMVHS
jgi:hypothetical protein